MTVIRIIFSLLAAAATFVFVLLVISVPILIHDTHIAPHDGQGGLSGFILGVPIAAAAAIVAGAYYYYLAERRGWFSK
jgi:hypothetical protein